MRRLDDRGDAEQILTDLTRLSDSDLEVSAPCLSEFYMYRSNGF